MEICGLGAGGGGDGDSYVPRKSAYSAEEAAAQQHSFWHSGLNTSAVRPGSEPATEGVGTWRTDFMVWRKYRASKLVLLFLAK